ncbi:MAG: D-alanyl-D-alanine carboxypeptidase [Methyloceanibacter sp.]|jgi:D-alanyl-D-alanine carboxypeptidase|uniref:D-alanyl-D-alanine carboxypeptidase n=1 Tax=Methyloceanibacter sp. TaxID=1965321 RepID=UPI003C7335B7
MLALAMILPSTGALARPKTRSSGSAIAADIVVDMNSGRILHEQASTAPRAPASLTKMMTLYVLFSYMRAGAVSPDSELVVTPYAASQAPTKLNLKPGATIRAADAVNALVTLSANDAAVTIAENLAGTEQNFARVMTRKAQELGMMSTLFRNASGLPNDEQVTTARDMAVLAQHLIRDFPEYYGCFQTRYFAYHGRRYRNHNRLLFGYKGTDGIKTGYTRAAGFNLTASVRRDDKHLVAVVLGGRTGGQRDAAMRALLDQSFPKAVAGRPRPVETAPLVARLETPAPPAPPPPVAKKRVFALASAGSAEPASFSDDSDVQVSAKPAAAPAAEMPADPMPTGPTTSSTASGPYHVQVGAFTSQAEAESRLGEVRGRASSVLDGHQPIAVVFQKDDTQWYRARFAGFSQDGAKNTCAQLKRMSFECVVMRAN